MQLKRNAKLPTDSAGVLDRVCEAYGFTTSGQLADHLEMASSSMSARRTRGVFPADIVVQCSLETGATLEWLATGENKTEKTTKLDLVEFKRKKLVDGQLYDLGLTSLDKAFFREGLHLPSTPICIQCDKAQYIVEQSFPEVYDGEWLINVEGKISIRNLVRIPINKVRVSGGEISFDCALKDIEVIGRVIMTITN